MIDLKMLKYWREEKGDVDALEDYFPKLLESNQELRFAVSQIRLCEKTIAAILDEIEGKNDQTI